MASAEDIKIRILGIDDASKVIGNVGTKIKGLQGIAGKSFGAIGKSAGVLKNSLFNLKTAVASIGVGVVGKQAVSTAAGFESLRVSLKTVTGSAEAGQAAFDRLADFAASTPFQLDEVVDGFIKLKSRGLEPSDRALEAYGNTAAAMGKSLDQMIEAVADASTGEFERLKEFGIKANKEGDKVRLTFQGVTHEIENDSAAIESYLMAIGETKFAGGMEEQSKTLNGLMSTLTDNVKQTTDKLVNESGLLDFLKETTSEATKFIQSIDIKQVVANIETARADLAAAFDSVVERVRAFKDGFMENFSGITGAFDELKVAFGLLMTTVFGEGGNNTDLWREFGDIIGSVLKIAFEALTLAIHGVVAVIDGLKIAWNEMTSLGEAAVDGLVSAFNSVKAKVYKITLDLLKAVQSLMQKMSWVVPDEAQKAVDGMISEFEKGYDVLVGNSIVPDMVDRIGQEMKRMGHDVKMYSGKAKDDMILNFEDMSDGVNDSIKNVLQGTTSLSEGLKGIAGMAVNKLYDKYIGSVISTGVDKLFSFDGGGYTGSGSRSGGVDGKGGFPAILHPNETVIDHTKGQTSGGDVTVVQNINVSTGVQQTVRTEIMGMMPQIASAAKGAVLDARRRGGSFAGAF
jgi:hypothetical protein